MYAQNFYGTGPGIIRRRRAYRVKAECFLDMDFFARSDEEAEELFNEFSDSVESRYPGIVLELKSIREDDE